MTRLILLLAALGLPGVAASDLQIERVIALGKLWADVRYFHSYLAYRDIEWDAALVKAIPKVKAAGSKEEYAAAIQSMLDTLEDPVTRVLKDAPRSAPEGNREPAQMDGDILVLRFTGAGVSPALRQETRKAGSALAAARGLVIDMRWVRNPDAILRDSGLVNNARGELILQRLSKTSLSVAHRARMHSGLVRPDLMGPAWSEAVFYSGFRTMSAARFEPAPDAVDVPVIFLLNEGSGIPAVAVALQTLGKGMIIAEGRLSEDSIVRTQRRKMPGDVEVQLRLSEVIHDDGTGGLAPDFVVPPRRPNDNEDKALRAAVEFARSPKQHTSVPRPRLPVVVGSSIDKPYADMPYPEAGYRVLAAFRTWSVIEYFFPYKDLMNEDWGAVLREFMQRFEAANNAREYQLAVTEMMSHLHDSHVGVTSPVLDKIFGALSPVGLRWIENSAVVTGFLDEAAANKSGIQVGDVILTVNGEDVRGRLERLKKYVSASTPGRLMQDALMRLLAGEYRTPVEVTGAGQE